MNKKVIIQNVAERRLARAESRRCLVSLTLSEDSLSSHLCSHVSLSWGLSPGRARSGKPKAYTGFYSNEKKRPENASQCETRALKRSRLCRACRAL